jgi:hypothetical protein
LWSSLIKCTATNRFDLAEDEGALPRGASVSEDLRELLTAAGCVRDVWELSRDCVWVICGGLDGDDIGGDFECIAKLEDTRACFVSYALSIMHRLSPTLEQ